MCKPDQPDIEPFGAFQDLISARGGGREASHDMIGDFRSIASRDLDRNETDMPRHREAFKK
jgi:hypothetical protein